MLAMLGDTYQAVTGRQSFCTLFALYGISIVTFTNCIYFQMEMGSAHTSSLAVGLEKRKAIRRVEAVCAIDCIVRDHPKSRRPQLTSPS
jgi:hypothetical protein